MMMMMMMMMMVMMMGGGAEEGDVDGGNNVPTHTLYKAPIHYTKLPHFCFHTRPVVFPHTTAIRSELRPINDTMKNKKIITVTAMVLHRRSKTKAASMVDDHDDDEN